MTRIRLALVAVLAMVGLSSLAAPGQAQSEMTFQIKSTFPYKVSVVLYSQDRKGHQWPGGNRVYAFNDSETHTMRIACLGGEKVCYGAWPTGDTSKYWGVGHNNSQRCSNCCYTCNYTQTQVITLR
jgi:hypothetical protein